jgi:hypothetical protein
MEQGVRFAEPACSNFPIEKMGDLKQKISMWVLVKINNWVRP